MSDRKTRRSRYFSIGRSRITRRLRIFQRNHLLDFVKISKYFKVRSGKRRAHEGLSTCRSTTTRRLRIFQRNHLLDFVKISKYFKVRSGKKFAHWGLVPMLGPNGSAYHGCSSVITFWTLKIFLKSVRPKDPPIAVFLDRQVENNSPIADLPA